MGAFEQADIGYVAKALRSARERVAPAEFRRFGALAVMGFGRSRWAQLASAEPRAGIAIAYKNDVVLPLRVQSRPQIVSRGEAVFRHFARLIVDRNNVRDQDKTEWSTLCDLARGISVQEIAAKMVTAEKTFGAATRQVQRLKNKVLGRILTGIRHLLPPAEIIRRAAA